MWSSIVEAHPLTSFWAHLEASNCHVVNKQTQSSFFTGKSSFFRASWIADYPDPENFLALFYSKNKSPFGPNYTHFSNEKYDSLYELSFIELNQSNLQYLLINIKFSFHGVRSC